MFLKNTFPNKFFNLIYLNQNANKQKKSQDNKTTLGRISTIFTKCMYIEIFFWNSRIPIIIQNIHKIILTYENYLTYENDGEY